MSQKMVVSKKTSTKKVTKPTKKKNDNVVVLEKNIWSKKLKLNSKWSLFWVLFVSLLLVLNLLVSLLLLLKSSNETLIKQAVSDAMKQEKMLEIWWEDNYNYLKSIYQSDNFAKVQKARLEKTKKIIDWGSNENILNKL